MTRMDLLSNHSLLVRWACVIHMISVECAVLCESLRDFQPYIFCKMSTHLRPFALCVELSILRGDSNLHSLIHCRIFYLCSYYPCWSGLIFLFPSWQISVKHKPSHAPNLTKLRESTQIVWQNKSLHNFFTCMVTLFLDQCSYWLLLWYVNQTPYFKDSVRLGGFQDLTPQIHATCSQWPLLHGLVLSNSAEIWEDIWPSSTVWMR